MKIHRRSNLSVNLINKQTLNSKCSSYSLRYHKIILKYMQNVNSQNYNCLIHLKFEIIRLTTYHGNLAIFKNYSKQTEAILSPFWTEW